MIRFPMAAAAGLALLPTLALGAPAQAGPRYVSLPIETSPVLAQAPRPAAAKAPGEAPETTSSLRPAPEKPWCPAGRRVGTGAGFCLIN